MWPFGQLSSNRRQESLYQRIQNLPGWFKWTERRARYREIVSGAEPYHGRPHTVILDLTSRCNLRCAMCFQSLHAKGSFVTSDLSDDCLEHSLSFTASASQVNLFGTGEPFLAKKLEEVVTTLHSSVDEIVISTNGTIYNERITRSLGKVTRLIFSIDSADAEQFERIRVGARFENVLDNIQVIRRDFPKLYLSFAVTVARYNLQECAAIMELAASLGVNHIQYHRMSAIGEAMQQEELNGSDALVVADVYRELSAMAERTGVTFSWGVICR